MLKKVVGVGLLIVVFFIVLVVWFKITHTRDRDNQSSITAGVAATDTPLPSNEDRGEQFTSNADEPISFSTDSLPVTVVKTSHTSAEVEGQYLVQHAQQCGPGERPHTYFSDIAKNLAKLPETVYNIDGTSSTTQPLYSVTLIPNLLGYKDLDSAQADFFVCKGDTNRFQAIALNQTWIAFGGSCAADDAQCQQVATTVKNSLHIK